MIWGRSTACICSSKPGTAPLVTDPSADAWLSATVGATLQPSPSRCRQQIADSAVAVRGDTKPPTHGGIVGPLAVASGNDDRLRGPCPHEAGPPNGLHGVDYLLFQFLPVDRRTAVGVAVHWHHPVTQTIAQSKEPVVAQDDGIFAAVLPSDALDPALQGRNIAVRMLGRLVQSDRTWDSQGF